MRSRSLEELARAFHEGPGDGETAFAYAQALDAGDREAEAIPVYRHALGCDLSPETEYRALVQLASSLRITGQPQQAVELHRKISERWPDRPANKLFLAFALLDAAMPAEAALQAISAALDHERAEDLSYYRRALEEYAAQRSGA